MLAKRERLTLGLNFFEILAGTKNPSGPDQDHASHALILGGLLEGFLQLPDQFQIKSIRPGTVNRQQQNTILQVQAQRAHRRSPAFV